MAGIYDKDNKKVSGFLEAVSKSARGEGSKRKPKKRRKKEEKDNGGFFSKLKGRLSGKSAADTVTEQLKKKR